MRTLVQTRMLAGDRGAYHLTKLLDTLQMPATVQAVLAARIDRLPPDEKRLLQTAAVIGTDGPWLLLQVLAKCPKADLHRGLTHLRRSSSMRRVFSPSWPTLSSTP